MDESVKIKRAQEMMDVLPKLYMIDFHGITNTFYWREACMNEVCSDKIRNNMQERNTIQDVDALFAIEKAGEAF